jgi:hypothetical protein
MNNQFTNYRYSNNSTFYIIFDKNLSTDNPLHAIVVQVLDDGKYVVTDATNNGDDEMTWETIVTMNPRLKPVKGVLTPDPLPETETKFYWGVQTGKLQDEFIKMSMKDKIRYIELGGTVTTGVEEQLPKPLKVLYAKNSSVALQKSTWLVLSPSDFNHALRMRFTAFWGGIPKINMFDDNPRARKILLTVLEGQDVRILVRYILQNEGNIRIPELESRILENHSYSIRYALNTMDARWSELETKYNIAEPSLSLINMGFINNAIIDGNVNFSVVTDNDIIYDDFYYILTHLYRKDPDELIHHLRSVLASEYTDIVQGLDNPTNSTKFSKELLSNFQTALYKVLSILERIRIFESNRTTVKRSHQIDFINKYFKKWVPKLIDLVCPIMSHYDHYYWMAVIDADAYFVVDLDNIENAKTLKKMRNSFYNSRFRYWTALDAALNGFSVNEYNNILLNHNSHTLPDQYRTTMFNAYNE